MSALSMRARCTTITDGVIATSPEPTALAAATLDHLVANPTHVIALEVVLA